MFYKVQQKGEHMVSTTYNILRSVASEMRLLEPRCETERIIYDKTINLSKHNFFGSSYYRIPNNHFLLYMMDNCTITVDTDLDDTFDFYNCYFHNCTFINIRNIQSIRFINCILEYCKVSNLYCDNIYFNKCKIKNVKFESSVVTDSIGLNWFMGLIPSNLHMSSIGVYLNKDIVADESMEDFDEIKKRFDHKYVEVRDCRINDYYHSCDKLIKKLDITGCYSSKDLSRQAVLVFGSEMDRNAIKRLMENSNILYNKIIDLPESGSFIGYKLVEHKSKFYVAELEIPEDAKRSCSLGYKCRCDKAKVVSVRSIYLDKYYIDHFHENPKIESEDILYYSPFSKTIPGCDKILTYQLNHEVSVNDFNENKWLECSTGIHFFMSVRDLVKEYYYEIQLHNSSLTLKSL